MEEVQGPRARMVRGLTCVVTGGLGFIGSNLVHRLVGSGARVRVVDALVPTHGGDLRNLQGADGAPLPNVETLIASIGDPSVADAIAGADVLFNFAGQVSHIASMEDPQLDLRLNATDHALLLETVRRVNPTVRIVHASTRQVYGRVESLPATETTAAAPVDVNGVSKLAGEHLHLVYHQAYGIAATSLRLSNVYGPRQCLVRDGLGFLPVFVRNGLRGEPIRLFGDGSQLRDCLHVDDVVDAALLATADAAAGRVYNVGNRRADSLAEIAGLIAATVAHDVPIVHVPFPDEIQRIDIGSFTTDSSRIADELGWTSAVEIAEGIKHTIAFYEDHPWYLSST